MKTFGGLVAVSAALSLAACAEAPAESDMEEETMEEETMDTAAEDMDGEAMETEAEGDEDLDPTSSPIGPGRGSAEDDG